MLVFLSDRKEAAIVFQYFVASNIFFYAVSFVVDKASLWIIAFRYIKIFAAVITIIIIIITINQNMPFSIKTLFF